MVEEGVVPLKRNRRVYLVGPNKGQPRPSWAARRKKREERELKREKEEFGEEGALEELELVRRLEVEEVRGLVKFRLGRGYREERDGVTEYEWYDGENDWEGEVIFLSVADISSGRRWFREEYPERWLEGYSEKELASMARRTRGDYGKEFVEFSGRWYEAVKEQ